MKDLRENKLIAFLTCFSFFLYTTPSLADESSKADEVTEQVTTLTLGDPAPFDGTLFSIPAAANILVQLENADAACQIKINKEIGITSTNLQYQLDVSQSRVIALQSEIDLVRTLNDDHIEFLTRQASANSKNNDALWLGGGIVGGILITVAAAWSLNQASGAN